jgi:hypothetical protein
MKMLKYLLLRFFILALFLTGCETPIDIEFPVPPPEIVVDGLITDQPGPYEVRLSYTAAYVSSAEGNNRPVTGAQVIIEDDAGNAELLEEYRPGIYLTSVGGIQGKTGNSYVLHITLMDGTVIESYPEKMLPSPDIDSIYYEFQPVSPNRLQGHRIYAVTKDPAGEQNFYRWKWQGFYIFYMISEMSTLACFRKEFDINKINVFSDRYINGQYFQQSVTLIPHFANDYYLIHVFQQSLTEDAYNFWNKANEQAAQVGSIFDRIPSKIKGNCYYADGTDQSIYGYFGASSISKKVHMMKFSTGVPPYYPREYGFRPCSSFPYTFDFEPSYPDTWPEGWEFF